MNEHELSRLDERAADRNPLTAQVGYYIYSSDACYQGQFKWFESVQALCHHVLHVELPLMPFDDEMSHALRTHLCPILDSVKATGLTEQAREAINDMDMGRQIGWWGTLQVLLSGQESFSLETLGLFNLRKGHGCGVAPEEISAFLAFLRDSPRMTYSAYEDARRYDDTF